MYPSIGLLRSKCSYLSTSHPSTSFSGGSPNACFKAAASRSCSSGTIRTSHYATMHRAFTCKVVPPSWFSWFINHSYWCYWSFKPTLLSMGHHRHHLVGMLDPPRLHSAVLPLPCFEANFPWLGEAAKQRRWSTAWPQGAAALTSAVINAERRTKNRPWSYSHFLWCFDVFSHGKSDMFDIFELTRGVPRNPSSSTGPVARLCRRSTPLKASAPSSSRQQIFGHTLLEYELVTVFCWETFTIRR